MFPPGITSPKTKELEATHAKARRTKINKTPEGSYHYMTRTVNGELLFKQSRERLKKPARHPRLFHDDGGLP